MNKLIKKAFTLIELLVVIAIIGILSGLIVVSMGGMTQKATIAKAQVFSSSLRNSLMMNLVSEWRLDENAGTTTVDSWNGGNVGTLTGPTHTPTWKTGSSCISNSCIQFDGYDDLINFGAKANLNFGTSNFTFALWAKIPSSFGSNYPTLLRKGTGSSEGRYSLQVNNDDSGKVYITVSDGTNDIPSTFATHATNDNLWHYYVMQFLNEPGTASLFIDGAFNAQASNTSIGAVNSASNLQLGQYSTYGYLIGLIDEVRIYNAAIPASQIKEQYYTGLNNLLINGGINKEEYLSRVNGLAIK